MSLHQDYYFNMKIGDHLTKLFHSKVLPKKRSSLYMKKKKVQDASLTLLAMKTDHHLATTLLKRDFRRFLPQYSQQGMTENIQTLVYSVKAQ